MFPGGDHGADQAESPIRFLLYQFQISQECDRFFRLAFGDRGAQFLRQCSVIIPERIKIEQRQYRGIVPFLEKFILPFFEGERAHGLERQELLIVLFAFAVCFRLVEMDQRRKVFGLFGFQLGQVNTTFNQLVADMALLLENLYHMRGVDGKSFCNEPVGEKQFRGFLFAIKIPQKFAVFKIVGHRLHTG
jgi:hypothetical protein